jgi:hypothetical protein
MEHQKVPKLPKAKAILRLSDLELSKNAVLRSLAASSQESSGHAIDEIITWCCSELRSPPAFQLTFHKSHSRNGSLNSGTWPRGSEDTRLICSSIERWSSASSRTRCNASE